METSIRQPQSGTTMMVIADLQNPIIMGPWFNPTRGKQSPSGTKKAIETKFENLSDQWRYLTDLLITKADKTGDQLYKYIRPTVSVLLGTAPLFGGGSPSVKHGVTNM